MADAARAWFTPQVEVLRLDAQTNGCDAAHPTTSRLVTSVTRHTLRGMPIDGRTAHEESLFVVLSGTPDVEAGIEEWPRRGTRTSPFEGPPVVLFVPRRTGFRFLGGHAEFVRFTARLPGDEPTRVAVDDDDDDLADPTDPTREAHLPQILLPRHFDDAACGDVRVRRLVRDDYRSRVLALQEAVVEANCTWSVATPEDAEVVAFVRTDAEIHASSNGVVARIRGDGVVRAAGGRPLTFRCDTGRAYVVVCSARDKRS